MTKVTVYKNNTGDITGFRCEDHAGFARAGRDIVCAAVSALVLNTINSIEKFTEDDFSGTQDEKNAVITFSLEPGYGRDSQLLLNSFVLGISNIMKEKLKFLSITFEEV
mgnify:CR=1 FL=1